MKKFFKKLWDKIKAFKSWSLFAKIVTGYVVLFMTGIVCICIWEWNLLVDYEKQNQDAKANSNPDVFIEQYVEELSEEKYREIIRESVSAVENPFCTADAIVEYVAVGYGEGSISGKKNADWTESRPAYDIYAGDNLLLTITLGVKSKDDFGYNVWQEGQIVLADTELFGSEISFIVANDMTVTLNGIPVTDEYIKEGVVSESAAGRVSEITGTDAGYNQYTIGNLLSNYELKVLDKNGNEISYTDVDGVRDYTLMAEGDDRTALYNRTVETMEAYAKLINKILYQSNMTKYFHPDGPLYKAFDSGEFYKSMHWNAAASSIEFVREEVTNIRRISDTMFICDIDFEVNKTYDQTENVNENLFHEVFTGQAIFVIKDGVWYLDTLSLQ